MVTKLMAFLATLFTIFALSLDPGCPQGEFGEGDVTEYPEEPVSGLTEHVWKRSPEDPQPVASGVQALEFARRGLVERLLIRGEEGSRLIFTSAVAPIRGHHEMAVRLDSAGWGLVLTLSYGKSWRGARSYNLLVEEEFGDGCGTNLLQTVRTTSGIELEIEAPLGRKSLANVAELLKDPDLVEDIRRNVPAPERQLIARLAKNVRNPTAVGVTHKSVIDLLTGALGGPAEAGWGVESQTHPDGLPPHLAELVSAFEALDGPDPLAGYHLTDWPLTD